MLAMQTNGYGYVQHPQWIAGRDEPADSGEPASAQLWLNLQTLDLRELFIRARTPAQYDTCVEAFLEVSRLAGEINPLRLHERR